MAEEAKTAAPAAPVSTVPATQNTAIARPTYLQGGDKRGTENITNADIQMPRLGIAQTNSPEVEEGNARFIADLKAGMFFNNVTRQIIPSPISFTVIRTERPRFIEFIPRTEGGGIRDYNVPADDPRTQFRQGEGGKTLPPLATKFYDFIILMLPVNMNDPMSNVIALSLKSTGLKVARQLNGLIKLRNAPSFAGKYKLTTKRETNSKGTWSGPVIENDGWVTEDEFKVASMAYDSLSGKTVHIDVEDTQVEEPEEEGIPAQTAEVVEGGAPDTGKM